MKQKILIVKLGFTETIDHKINSDSVSLGDIFRTTSILNIFKDDEVSWLTSKEGLPLLTGNPFIKRILVYDLATVLQLQAEQFDVVVNLERIPGICALTDSISAWRRYGFRFDAQKGIAEAYEHSYEVLANSDDPQLRKMMKKHWIEMLFEMIGKKWNGECYILGYRPKTKKRFDVGFNTNVGKKWPNKAWSMENWKRLQDIIGDRYSVSYQQSLNDIFGYIDWLNSCRVIITNDSLGLHLALALGKNIIALFGPSSEKEIHLFGRGIALLPPDKPDCLPCFNTFCKFERNCIDNIRPEMVYEKIERLLSNQNPVIEESYDRQS